MIEELEIFYFCYLKVFSSTIAFEILSQHLFLVQLLFINDWIVLSLFQCTTIFRRIIKLIKHMNFSTMLPASSINSTNHFKFENSRKSPVKKTPSKLQKEEAFLKSSPIRPRTLSDYSPTIRFKNHFAPHPTESHQNQQVCSSQFLVKSPQISPSHRMNLNCFNSKNRKDSENNRIYQNGSGHQLNKSVILESNDRAWKRQINHAAYVSQKSRIISCNTDTAPFWKKNGQKNGENDDCPQNRGIYQNHNSKSPKRKRINWEQAKNFQLGSNHSSSDQNRTDIANVHIQIAPIPKIFNLRKHSENENVKKVPSFLTNNKYHKNSVDVAQFMHKQNLGIENFVQLKELGKGAFGKVILAMQKQIQFICAIKIISKNTIREDNMLEQLIRQIKIQMRINHPNIIKVYGFFDDLLNLYIVMESALDGQLSDFMEKNTEPLPEIAATGIFHQICEAVSVLHSESIIHRDLKPENVMLHEKIVKICDFGWSVYRGSTLRSTFCGTPIYLCPQILIGDEYDESIDIWALGVMLYQMLFKNNPFRITCRQELVNIINEPIYFNDQMLVSEAAKNIIKQCLTKRAIQRPNIRELLLHQFFLNVQGSNQCKR